MAKRSAFKCPQCGGTSLRVVRTTLVTDTRRIRFYVCQSPGCGGLVDTEERVMRPVRADVHDDGGQPPEYPW